MDQICIFCKRVTDPSAPDEHIVPEGLGGGPPLVLTGGEVCERCNIGKLSRVDAHLVRPFEPFRPFFVKELKGKRFPKSQIGQARIERRRQGGPHIDLAVPPESLVRPLKFERNDRGSTLSLSAEITFDLGFSRGLHKVALEYVCLDAGRETALWERFDVARRYALDGRGPFRPILMRAGASDWRGPRAPRIAAVRIGGQHFGLAVELCGSQFIVSLDHDAQTMYAVCKRLNADAGTTVWRSFGQKGRVKV